MGLLKMWRLDRRQRAGGSVYRSAKRAAYSNASDVDGVARIVEAMNEAPGRAPSALSAIDADEPGFVNDRAHRLLVAAMTGLPVAAQDPTRAADLTREEELGRLPLTEAYERLCAAIPELGTIPPDASARVSRARDLLASSSATDPVLATGTALGAFVAYFSALEDDDTQTTYFDRVLSGRPLFTARGEFGRG